MKGDKFFMLLIFAMLFSFLDASVSAETLDLNHSNIIESYANLDGAWYFFEEALLEPSEVILDEGQIVSIPDSFKNHTGHINSYGTYALVVKIPDALLNEPLAIHIPYQYSAYKFYVDDTLITKNGTPGTSSKSHIHTMAPRVARFSVSEHTFLLTMQVSSFDHIRGGFENPIFIGKESAILSRFYTNLIFNVFTNGAIFVMGFFLVLMSISQKNVFSNLTFGLFAMSIGIRSLFAVPFNYTLIFPNMSWVWGTRLEYLLTESAVLFFFLFLWSLYKSVFANWILMLSVVLSSVTLILTFFTQPIFFQDLFFKVFYVGVFVSIYILIKVVRSFKKHDTQNRVNLFGIAMVIIAFLNDYFVGQDYYRANNLMMISVSIYILLQMLVLTQKFSAQAKLHESLNKELSTLNSSLNLQVAKRTKELQDANLHLKDLVNKDGLTGLYNYSYFRKVFDQIFSDFQHHQNPVSLCIIDVDNFKAYNDNYGHIKGDKMLKRIAQSILESMPESGFLARYGGEEFALILKDTDHQEALEVADKIRGHLEDKQYIHEFSPMGVVTISIGVAALNQDAHYQKTSQWFEKADQNLYLSKSKGKNTVD